LKDFIYDKTTKKIFADGDLSTGNSELQHQELLIVCEPGSFKEFPATCVGAGGYLEDNDPAGLLREIRNQFVSDGMKVKSIGFDNNRLKYNASY
jgi:hypothetical protein